MMMPTACWMPWTTVRPFPMSDSLTVTVTVSVIPGSRRHCLLLPGIEKVAPTLPATLDLGGFQVIATADSLVVRHSDEPARDLFAPPNGGVGFT